MSDEKPTTLRHEPEQTRSNITLERLKTAATMLYNDPNVGRDRLTTGMVAELANVSIGTVYRYWSDRVQILDTIAPDRDQSKISSE